MSKSLTEMAADLVTAQCAMQPMSQEEINEALAQTFQMLQKLHGQETGEGVEEENPNRPDIDPKRSITRKKIICMECGKAFKILSSRHLAQHGLNSKSYREKYGFPRSQPLCCKELSEIRSNSAKERGGIPENLRKSIEARKGKPKTRTRKAADKAS